MWPCDIGVVFHDVLEDWCAFIGKVKHFWAIYQVTKCHNPRTWVHTNIIVRTSSVASFCGPHSLFWNSHFLCLVLRRLMRWLFRWSSLFPNCSYDSSQHNILVSCLSAHRFFIVYWPDRTCTVMLCGTDLSMLVWIFFLLYDVLHQYNIHIKHSVLCVQDKGIIFKLYQNFRTIHSVHCK